MKLRRVLGLLVALCVVCGSLALSTSAETVTAGVPDGLKYEVYDDHVVITGYSGSETEVVIPAYIEEKPVTALGEYAFAYRNQLKHVSLPDGLTSIEKYAFSDCYRLENVKIPDSVTSIGEHAFSGCDGFTEIEIPDGVTRIEDFVFSLCDGLESITLPDSVTSIGIHSFSYCTNLLSINLPDGITSISTSAFVNCVRLQNFTIPDSVTVIEDRAFYDCYNFDDLHIPGSVKSIGDAAFYGLTGVLTFEGDAPEIHEAAFSGSARVTAYYPKGNATWTDEVKQNYGGTVDWRACCTVPHVWLEATCTQPKHCKNCEATEGRARGHSSTYYPAKAATCTESGHDVYAVCSRCDYTTYVEQPATGHAVKDGVCVSCGYIPVKITTQPKTTYTKSGSTAKVTVKAAGDGLKYTWYIKNKGAKKFTKSSTTTSTYSVKMSSKVKDRQVYCVVKDEAGESVKTKTVTLRMAATVTTQPKTTYTKSGSTAKVTVKAAGDGLKYTWYYKNKGASKFTKSSTTTSAYSVKMSSKVKDRQVYCVIKDKYGKSVKTKTVTLRMAATVTTQPKTAYAKNGATAKVTVKAAGDGLTYTWYVKNKGATKFAKSSTTTSAYSVKMSSKVKDRQVYCVVKDKYGKSVKTKTVILRMAASITTQPQAVKVKKNATAKVTVKAAGDGLTYTWYVKDKGAAKFTKASAATSAYSVKMTSKVNGRQVYCVVKDKYGKSVKSKTVQLTMAKAKCPLCGKTDCKGAKTNKKKDCPTYVGECPYCGGNHFLSTCPVAAADAENKEDEKTVCGYCGTTNCDYPSTGDVYKCPEYDEKKDATKYCQTCGKSTSVCERWTVKHTCERCGEVVPKRTCHHCKKK